MRPTIFEFMDEVERNFDQVWRNDRLAAKATRSFVPAVDLHETPEFFLVSLDLPGMSEKDIQIGVHESRLTVSGERVRDERNDEGLFRRFERASGKFERSFQMPTNVNAEKIQARFENGVLEIMIPKSESAKPRQVPIESGKGGLFSRLLGQKTVDAAEKKNGH